MATHSGILAWKIPWTEEPGMLQSMDSQRVRHDWACMHTFLSWWKINLLFWSFSGRVLLPPTFPSLCIPGNNYITSFWYSVCILKLDLNGAQSPRKMPKYLTSFILFRKFVYTHHLINAWEGFPGSSMVKTLPMQGTQVRSLVQEDLTCWATKPMHHNYWACTLKPREPQLLNPEPLQPMPQEKPPQWEPVHCN